MPLLLNKKFNNLLDSTQYIEKLSLIPLLYQTGYLTIEKIGRDGLRPYYFLNYPNKEVQYSYLNHIVPLLSDKMEVSKLQANSTPKFTKH